MERWTFWKDGKDKHFEKIAKMNIFKRWQRWKFKNPHGRCWRPPTLTTTRSSSRSGSASGWDMATESSLVTQGIIYIVHMLTVDHVFNHELRYINQPWYVTKRQIDKKMLKDKKTKKWWLGLRKHPMNYLDRKGESGGQYHQDLFTYWAQWSMI